MSRQERVAKQRQRREYRVRSVRGNSSRLRVSVHRSNKAFSVQVIDDVKGVTIASASSFDPEISGKLSNCGNCEAAAAVGRLIASKSLAIGVKEVRLDRGRYRYHGRVRAFAEAAREGGLEF